MKHAPKMFTENGFISFLPSILPTLPILPSLFLHPVPAFFGLGPHSPVSVFPPFLIHAPPPKTHTNYNCFGAGARPPLFYSFSFYLDNSRYSDTCTYSK